MSRALKIDDVLKLSKLYEAEFNRPDIHDRILVFDVIGSASRQRSQSKQSVEERDSNEDEESIQSEDERIKTATSDNEADQTENKETETSTCDSAEKEVENNDFKIGGEQSKTDETDASDEVKTHDVQTATSEASKTEVATEATKKESALNENVEITQTTRHENDSKSLQDSEIIEDTDENLNKKEQSEKDSETENYGSDSSVSEDQIIRQHKFYIHSSWLALQSSYFRSMFFSGMKESNAKEVHVQISVCEEKSHLMLLEAMYKIDTLDNASVDELLEVLRLAHKYDVKFVFKKCKYCLQAAVVSLEICEQIMRFIKIDNEVTDVQDLASTLQSFLAKEFSPLDQTWQTTSFEALCEPSLRYLLSSNELVAASENTIFHALIHWIEQRGLDSVSNGGGLLSLLSVVRFELLPIDYLYNIVQHNPVAKNMVDFNRHYLRGISYHALSEEMRQKLFCKPRKRKDDVESYVPYTWVIPLEKLFELDGTEEKLVSDKFWFSGYKMMLGITHVRQEEYHERYVATLHLQVINLTRQSVVTISWYPKSQFIALTSNTTHTFKMDARVSSCNIRWNIDTVLDSMTPDIDLPVFNVGNLSGPSRTKRASRKVVKTKVSGTQPIKPSFSPPPNFSSSFATNTNTLGSSKVNSPKPEPCLSFDVQMNLV